MYVEEYRANSVAFIGFRCSKKSYRINLFITFGFGLMVTTSNPKFFKFSIFFLPISVIFSGSQFTKRQLRSNLSLAVIACLVLSFPPLTPIVQS